MAIPEAARSDLYTGLSETIGPDRAETLMSAIPLYQLDEVAKGDLRALGSDLRTEMADLRTELKTDIADLRTEMADLRTEIKTDIAELRTELADLRTELKTDIGDLRAEMIGEIDALRRSMTTWMLTILVTMLAAMVGISFLP